MSIITTSAYARAGLVGNPSDGYFGKTISFIIRNFRARVSLWESPHFEILPTSGDLARFDSVGNFLRDVKLNGYYGGLRLQKAAVKKFHEYAAKNDIELHHNCGGVCACTTCHLYIEKGMDYVDEITDKEEDFIDRAVNPRLNSRLGCQSLLNEGSGEIEVLIPDQTQFLGE